MEVHKGHQSLSAALGEVRAKGAQIGLVPTMGALHGGHQALIAASAGSCEATVVSVFVNPLQFEDEADLAHYPRTLEEDLQLAEAAGAQHCFVPTVEEMYPSGPPTIRVDPGRIGAILEGASRPGHLGGMVTVVAKLFAAIRPDKAFFGEKDYQQLVLVRHLAADLSFPVEVVGVPTLREPDGLAMSSRNRRLSSSERVAAGALYRALLAGRHIIEAGGPPERAAKVMAAELTAAPLVDLDYAVVRRSEDLGEVSDRSPAASLRLLVAARVGSVRLIDNLGADQ